jgi:hypothetical protein
MFTFSPGFEAATLKIPNKEYNAYGSGGSTAPSGSMRPSVNGYNQTYAGPNDPYNLVTVNQGGVVVDNGRDGTMASWPASVPGMPQDDAGSHFVPNGGSMPTVPPRKQIIGFAKFRSRSEALEARDVLQGRRVDIEKGAVLKAEMAKKNLHTKRGVGPLPLPLSGFSGGGGLVVPDAMGLSSGLGSMNGLGGIPPGAGMEISARERELGALGAMGLGSMGQWRDPSRIVENEEDRERRRDRESSVINAMGLASATRGPRERAEEDERERERRRKEKELRMRSANMTAFDAFHSVPSQTISRHPSMSLLSCTSVMDGCSSPVLTNGFGHGMKTEDDHHNDNAGALGPWDSVPLNGVRMSSVSLMPNQPPIRPPPSSGQSSPPPQDAFSPRSNVADLPAHQPSSESQPGSSASSVIDGPAPGSAPKAALTVATDAGDASPQLPSPVSGASSTSARNVIDQNPPVSRFSLRAFENLPIIDQHVVRWQFAYLVDVRLSAQSPRGQSA